jgi:hypothetical protein
MTVSPGTSGLARHLYLLDNLLFDDDGLARHLYLCRTG